MRKCDRMTSPVLEGLHHPDRVGVPAGERPPASAFNVDPHSPEHVLYFERTPQSSPGASRRSAGSRTARTCACYTRRPDAAPPVRASTCAPSWLEPSERREAGVGVGTRTYWTLARPAPAEDAAYAWEQPPAEARRKHWAEPLRLGLGVRGGREGLRSTPRLLNPRRRPAQLARCASRPATRVAESSRPGMLLKSALPVRRYLTRGTYGPSCSS